MVTVIMTTVIIKVFYYQNGEITNNNLNKHYTSFYLFLSNIEDLIYQVLFKILKAAQITLKYSIIYKLHLIYERLCIFPYCGIALSLHGV